MTQWQGASVAAAVAQVVESLAAGDVGKRRADPQRRILVASYMEDFDYLWAWQKNLTDWFALGGRHIIVVWDGTPPPGRLGQYNVAEYLTPADWSVMMTLAAKEVPRLTIVDFASHRHESARTLQTFRHLRRMSPSPLPHVHEVNLTGVKQFFSTLSTHASTIQPTSEDRSMLRALWNSMLGEGKGTHHAIANIVGPFLLLESLQRSTPKDGAVVPAALRQLIRVLQAPDQKSASEAGTEAGGKQPWFDFTRNLGRWADSVVLIDDLAENGWGEVLRAMLGLDAGDRTVRVYLSPVAGGPGNESAALDLPGHLRRRLDWLRSDKKGYSAPPLLIPNAKNPLVFLDIRLFSQSSLEQERRFYKDLLVLAREFAALPTAGWPVDLSDKTLERVERFADAQADLESPDHHAALSLLPRLLALADPTLPIVLFSSTGRRAVVEPLTLCGNVIFDFEKPRLTGGDWNEVMDRARIGFKHAMERVTPLLRARSFLQELREDASRTAQLLEDAAATKSECVEVYLDESGENRFSVGGIIVLYPNRRARDELDQVLKEQELVWGLAEGHPPVDANDAIPKRPIPKYPGGRPWKPGAYIDFLERLSKCFVDLNVRLAAFALIWEPRMAKISEGLPEPLREDVIDNRYRRMIEESLEAVLYCVLPARGATDAQVAVDCATRTQDLLPPYDAKRLKTDFGIGSNRRGKRNYYYVLSADSIYPIIGRLLASRPDAPPNVRRARGTTLYDYEELARKDAEDYERIVKDRSRPRQIHYLADWFARFGLHYPDLPDAEIVAKAFKGGFLERRGERFAGWLRASRAGAEERLTDALTEVWMATRQKEAKWSVARWLRRRAADWGEMLDGPGFVELATRIDAKSAQEWLGHKQKTEAPVLETRQAGPADEKVASVRSITEIFERLVPGARRGDVQLKRAAIEGNRAIIAVAGKNAVAQTIGKKGAVIKQLAGELKVKIDVIEWWADPVELARRALKEKGSGASITRNNEGRIEVGLPSWIQVTAEETRLVSSLIESEIIVVSKASGQTK
jgi:hypothetical protein